MSAQRVTIAACLAALVAGSAAAEPVQIACFDAAQVTATLAEDQGARWLASPVDLLGQRYEIWGSEADGWTMFLVASRQGQPMLCPLMSGPDLGAVTAVFGLPL